MASSKSNNRICYCQNHDFGCLKNTTWKLCWMSSVRFSEKVSGCKTNFNSRESYWHTRKKMSKKFFGSIREQCRANIEKHPDWKLDPTKSKKALPNAKKWPRNIILNSRELKLKILLKKRGGVSFIWLDDKYLTHYRRPAVLFRNRKNILEDLFSSVLSQFKKYHPSVNLKFNN